MGLILIQGPAGGGKSQLAAEMLAAGEISILSDITALWAALSGAVRGPDGLYPVRQDDDPALAIAQYVQTVAVRRAVEEDEDVGVTTSRRGQESRWQRLAELAATTFAVRTVDPGCEVVENRLSDASGTLSDECRKAIARWYENEQFRGLDQRAARS